MAMIRRIRLAILFAACALLSGCVIAPSGWDARSDGGRYDPGWDDPYNVGQPGVEDLRTKSQNDWGFHIG